MKDKQTAEEAIELISGRIMDEYRKHQSLDWAKIAARKIHSQWFEYYNQQNQELQRQVEKLKDAVEFAEWISVEDRLPTNSIQEVICVRKTKYSVNSYSVPLTWRDGKFQFFLETYVTIPDVTHWMPLPKPPIQTK